MPVVLVHGNPETAAIWDDLRTELGRDDVLALSPPGFGAPVPDGFAATSDAYVAWLGSELERIPGPIDLVGHDWGAGHVMRLVLERPQLVRSWAMDIAGCFDPEYVWHDFAQVWQTPGAGEEAIAQMVATPVDQRAQQFEGLGMSKAVAASCAAASNEAMGRCILALYRSAAQPRLAQWGADLSKARTRPGLVIIATEDHYTGGETLARRTAERAGAEVAVLQGLGHWWMCQDPKRGAEALRTFFAALPA
ncbi:MAG TPA: alpha/beta hydrolase [Dehalococcoidia bacterium]|nr:alpha/beta hydrolase [Dehalococcoidia bacterium]